MIVYIQGKSGDASSRGYLALRRLDDGDWEPISIHLLPSSDAAFDVCIRELGLQVSGLNDEIARRIENIEIRLDRLQGRPRPPDRIRILGQSCEVGEDGSITMPSDLRVKPGAKFQPRLALADVELGPIMHQAIQRATGQPDLTRERALQVLIDGVEGEPLEVLLSIEKTTPALRDEFTTLMLDIATKRGYQPSWNRGWTDDPEPDSEPSTEPPAEPLTEPPAEPAE